MTILDFIQLGEPITERSVSITPLYPRRTPIAEYTTLDVSLERGLQITEVGAEGVVPELLVRNPLDDQVLLYDGEELLGAKQNRILNLTVLMAAKSTLVIPVSCVEEGRWSSRSPQFGAATHISHSHLRRRKAEALAARPLVRGIAQGEVWDEVRAKAARMAVDSPTLANADVFRAYELDLTTLESAFPAMPGQSGALVAIGNTYCMDWVSQPFAFERLWPKLRRGYLLDALEAAGPADCEGALAFFEAGLSATATRQRSAGLGSDVRLRGPGLVASGLELDNELLQLCAFSSDQGPRAARLARPSHRRH